jgi:hypothetical protein
MLVKYSIQSSFLSRIERYNFHREMAAQENRMVIHHSKQNRVRELFYESTWI